MRLRATPNDDGRRSPLKIATKQLTCARAEGVQRLFEDCISRLAGRIRGSDQFGFYKHIKGMDMEGKGTFISYQGQGRKIAA